jgi:hypothetical protein
MNALLLPLDEPPSLFINLNAFEKCSGPIQCLY